MINYTAILIFTKHQRAIPVYKMSHKEALFDYLIRLGDTSLIAGQRLSEWCGHGPILEEDIAMTNISLDLIGQARQFLTYAGEVEGKGRDEDALAYHRDVWEFKNVKLVEQPNGDFAQTILKHFFLSTFNCLLYGALSKSIDETLAAIATKSLKEVLYHKRHSTEWVKRLGDGTEESNKRINFALNELWTFTGELFEMTEVDEILVKEGIASDLNELYLRWLNEVNEVFEEATLDAPSDVFMATGSRKGLHTEHLGYILAEMQFLPRAYPDAKW